MDFHIGFLELRLLDMIDILLVSYLFYRLYYLLKGGAAISILSGILFFYLLWLIFAKFLKMELIGSILGQFIGVGVLAIIIVFQQEIRRFLLLIGSNQLINKSYLFKKFTGGFQKTSELGLEIIPILKACTQMSKTRTGAIIVIARSSELKFFSNTGDILDAKISKRLIESIFSKHSPLHDGAIIISENRIRAARCVLPVTDNPDIPARLGMRHRSAIGISEQSDAIVIVVSEETGEISMAKDGQIITGLTVDEIQKKLEIEFTKSS
jgi:diadenylate cyclase